MLQTLQQAGYGVCLQNERTLGGEKVADLQVIFGGSSPMSPDPDLAVTMIDEYPAMMLLASFAKGTSRFAGIGELRVKESDRIAQMEKLLLEHGVVVRSGTDWVEIDGTGSVFGPIQRFDAMPDITVEGDHRIAMCALVLGMSSYLPISIVDGSSIATSYPEFIADMQSLGGKMTVETTARPLVIAVDGPMASGKGTLARKLAAHFNLPYLDTGLLYRATARAALQENIDLGDQGAIAALAKSLSLPIMQVEELRLAHIGVAASRVAALPKVREALLKLQREFSKNPDGAVLDGRDIGTIICPDADVKLWITASEKVRAERRRQELLQNGQEISAKAMLAQLQERDARDAARDNAPMTMAANAHLIDTSKLSIDAALQVARQWVERKMD
jgi:cytidylate kinase